MLSHFLVHDLFLLGFDQYRCVLSTMMSITQCWNKVVMLLYKGLCLSNMRMGRREQGEDALMITREDARDVIQEMDEG